MLPITIPRTKLYNRKKSEFIYIEEQKLEFEHSLLSLKEWESKWHIPFIGLDAKAKRTKEQNQDYFRCMCLTKDVDPNTFLYLPKSIYQKISKYIEDPMTATWFSDPPGPKAHNRIVITAERIYYWMFSYNIPKECETWHLNQLMTLIRVFSEENQPPKKKKQAEIARFYHQLNESRKAQLGTKG